MGNRGSSARKQNPNVVNGKRTTNNGTQSAQYNDKSYTRTKADEAADQRPSLNLTMYRSLSQTDQSGDAAGKAEIRLHRRSFLVGGHASDVRGGQRGPPSANVENTTNNWAARTLPRSFGRSRSAASPAKLSDDIDVVARRNRQLVASSSRRRPQSNCSIVKSPRNVHSTRPSSSFDVVHDVDDPVEFPDYETIRRRTAAFQQRFVEHFMTLYSSLPSSVQISALSVAVRRRSSQPINHVETSSSSASQDIVTSLHQYLCAGTSCADVPLQLPASEYALTVSPAHFDLVRRARVDGCADPAGLSRLVVTDVAAEAAAELARAFEYQLILLGDEEGLAARLGAQRGAERAMEYLKRTSRHVDVNSLLHGVVEGRPLDAPATVSAIIGRRYELHWNVDDMFLRPGLRRERLLVAGGVHVLGGYGTPWRLYASTEGTDATLYGYRGQLLARDFHSEWLRGGRQPAYHLDVDEEAAYDIEVPWRSDDFHRIYRPYRRLVGSAVMASYAALSDEEKSHLNLCEFVQRLHGDAFRRDDVEAVFRPLTSSFCREELTPAVKYPVLNSTASAYFTSLTTRDFCREESALCSNSMPENNTPTYAEYPASATEQRRQESVPTPRSTVKNNSPTFHSVEPIHDRAGMDQVPVSLTRSPCAEVPVSGMNSTDCVRDQNIPEVGQRRISESADQPAVCPVAAQRRPPPPAVKPKPSLELRRRQTMTSLPVTGRQSSAPVNGSDSTPGVTVQFPTLDELFGPELAAIRQSTYLPESVDTDNSQPASRNCYIK